MQKHIISLGDTKFSIGYAGENKARLFLFEICNWIDEYDGEGTPILLIQRPFDTVPYPVDIVSNGHCALWTPTSLDTEFAGEGTAQLEYVIDDKIVKNKVYKIVVEKSIGDEGEIPDPIPSWIDKIIEIGLRVEEAAKHAPKIIDNNWYVWDVEANDFVDTGVSATEPGPEGPAGPPGKAGPAGPAGVGVPEGGFRGQVLFKTGLEDYTTSWKDPKFDKNYTHDQLVPSTFWEIEHNLEKYPSVNVIDSGGTLVVGDIKYIDNNHLTIKFQSQFSGKAYLN